MTNTLAVHSFAILKGAVEGDDGKHLGSLMEMDHHAAPLLRAGLVDEGEDGYVPTDAGRRFYDEHRLQDLPDGRANYWQSNADALAILLDAQQDLDALQP